MTSTVILFGVESVFAAEVAEILKRLGRSVHAGIITGEPEWDMTGIELLLEEKDVDDGIVSMPAAVPWVTPKFRRDRIRRARALGFRNFPAIVDHTAIAASTAILAEGVLVNAGTVIGAHARVAPHCLLNRNVSIGHHSVLDEFVSTGPGVNIAGRCRIGRGAMIATGAAVAPGTTIGAHAVVGVGAGVIRDVPEGVVVLGSPARVARSANAR